MTVADKFDVAKALDGLPAFLTRRQIATALGIAYYTLRHWQRQGKFPQPSRKFGVRPRWTKRAVIEWAAKEHRHVN